MFEFHHSTDCTLLLFQTNLTERPGRNTEYSGKYEGCKCYCFSGLFIILLLTALLNAIVNTVLTLLDHWRHEFPAAEYMLNFQTFFADLKRTGYSFTSRQDSGRIFNTREKKESKNCYIEITAFFSRKEGNKWIFQMQTCLKDL